mmetsp:Transcript_28214/g.44742  ORF Transcript_28214/g.44742 Transcript_28214/m.44742 type:complete len:227 (-) Transcript_28214:170-850(-)
MNALHLLESSQRFLFGDALHIHSDGLLHLIVLDNLRWISTDMTEPILFAPRAGKHLHIGIHHSNQVRLIRISVHKYVAHQRRQLVHILNEIRSNILSLRQLEDILFAVHNLQFSVEPPLPNISRCKPPVLVEHLFCLLLHSVISAEQRRSTKPYLTAWQRLIVDGIVHILDVDQLHLHRTHHSANLSIQRVIRVSASASRARFRQSISFDHHIAEARLEEIGQCRR